MRVTNIDISDLHYGDAGAAGAQHEGYVSMELQPFARGAPLHVQFLCHAAQSEDCPSTIIMHDLITDALRQAHRMPGFRRGERHIEVDVSTAHVSTRRA